MGLKFSEMQEMYRGIVKRFNRIEGRPWQAQGAMIELTKQVGELAKQVMLKENYYAWAGGEAEVKERLGNEMADVIAQVMRLAGPLSDRPGTGFYRGQRGRRKLFEIQECLGLV